MTYHVRRIILRKIGPFQIHVCSICHYSYTVVFIFFRIYLLFFFLHFLVTTTTRHLASSWSNTANLVDLFLTSRFIEYTGNLSLSRRLAHLRRVLKSVFVFSKRLWVGPQSQQRCTRFGYLAPRCLPLLPLTHSFLRLFSSHSAPFTLSTGPFQAPFTLNNNY